MEAVVIDAINLETKQSYWKISSRSSSFEKQFSVVPTKSNLAYT